MSFDPSNLTTTNPVFHAYVLAASFMLLKLMLQPWMTVQRMMKVHAGFRSPEDARQTPLNPDPREGQLEPNEYVERSRRMNLNDLESIPGFLAAGFLFVLAGPPVLFGKILIWTYVGTRAAHFLAYATAQIHDIRATLWTFSSLSVLVMTGYVLVQAI
jgi:glutathione S-transferase